MECSALAYETNPMQQALGDAYLPNSDLTFGWFSGFIRNLAWSTSTCICARLCCAEVTDFLSLTTSVLASSFRLAAAICDGQPTKTGG